jgi:hypothetical protein
MSRIGNIKVFDEGVDGTITIVSDPQHNDAIGRADSFTVQVYASNAGGTDPTLTLKYWGSNDGKNFITRQTLLNGVSISATPYESMTDSTPDLVCSAQGRFELTLGGSNPNAYVRVVVCTRSE